MYKRNFVEEQKADSYRLNLARFDIWVNEVVLDEQGKIVSMPSFEKAQEIVSKIAIDPTFQINANLVKNQIVDGLEEKEVESQGTT